jgi:hypothetical protein
MKAQKQVYDELLADSEHRLSELAAQLEIAAGQQEEFHTRFNRALAGFVWRVTEPIESRLKTHGPLNECSEKASRRNVPCRCEGTGTSQGVTVEVIQTR